MAPIDQAGRLLLPQMEHCRKKEIIQRMDEENESIPKMDSWFLSLSFV